MQLAPLSLAPNPSAPSRYKRYPRSVPQWLRDFRQSSAVITDSFHGTVFSLIFNKPFVCIGNINRGMSRFHSLLARTGLEARLLVDPTPTQIVNTLQTPIEWDLVNQHLNTERERGLTFLKKHLPQ